MKRIAIILAAALVAAMLFAPFVRAAEYLKAENPYGSLALFSEPRGCPEGLRRALWVSSAGSLVPGCWFEAYEVVWVIYADGDMGGYPRAMFREMQV